VGQLWGFAYDFVHVDSLQPNLGSSDEIEYMPWVSGAFAEPAVMKNGRMMPPQQPGLGLEIPEEIIQRFRFE